MAKILAGNKTLTSFTSRVRITNLDRGYVLVRKIECVIKSDSLEMSNDDEDEDKDEGKDLEIEVEEVTTTERTYTNEDGEEITEVLESEPVKTSKKASSKEDCLEGYQIFSVMYLLEASAEGYVTKEFIAVWEESEQKEFYVCLDDMPENYELHNYEFHQRLNRCCNEKELSLPDYLETHAFNPESKKNMLIKNTKGKWDFMNGKAKDKEYFEFL